MSAIRVLVTGAAGFIGSWVALEAAERGFKVRAVDCFLEESYAADEKRRNWQRLIDSGAIELVQHDLRAPLPNGLLSNVDAIINEAGMPGLMKSWTDFELYLACNVTVVEQIARAALENDVNHLIQVSTSSVYGDIADGGEDMPLRPISPYGVSKLAAEELVRAYARSYGLNFTILRYFSVYGPGQRPDMAYRRIIDAVLAGREVDVFGDGQQSRSNTYVADCARATVDALDEKAFGETLNIAGGEHHSLLRAIGFVEEAVGRSASLRFRPARPGDQVRTSGSTARALRCLDYRPTVSLRTGIAHQVAWQEESLLRAA